MLLMLTDVDAVYTGYGTRAARALDQVNPATLSAKDFAAGSMGPKVAFAIEFAKRTGKPAAIGKLDDALAIVQHQRGTWFDNSIPMDDISKSG